MQSEQTPIWFLRKHGQGEIFGPVSFSQIREWSTGAQINPQDSISSDGVVWTKAPMMTELKMDWLIEVPANPLYGPTTEGALLEFLKEGEIDLNTSIVNCCTGETMTVCEAPFYNKTMVGSDHDSATSADSKEIKTNLPKRIHRLETALLEKQVLLNTAKVTMDRLRHRVEELEKENANLRDTLHSLQRGR